MRTRPDMIETLSLEKGQRFLLDEHGYLTDPDSWTPEFAEHAAAGEGITLTDRHWQVIDFVRDEAEANGIIPDVRFVMAFLGDGNKRAGRAELFDLFPYGYVKQTIKIAGMKQPRAWSTG
ncbi:TusE/DsrC/DsvC family sulfur relay protein [Aliiroseovarius subalbicans]|uniref:TusE/DsrC/DsvC family sulfur relay protein n=1 Tax=Aliiroseovarius subalbicans TaxID=2925840 RepID=UPI001F591AE8|nr:TusE/DsrC/DsvC family sulfur relay protein [Aliiroseovarius subalbicans]MCI2399150.1 TusE/DsrC/DsvC family sulfur relay protein [Aliiroseovarius subalbicans]